jgi:hypothetical protein
MKLPPSSGPPDLSVVKEMQYSFRFRSLCICLFSVRD